jgi:hypothetical protein
VFSQIVCSMPSMTFKNQQGPDAKIHEHAEENVSPVEVRVAGNYAGG